MPRTKDEILKEFTSLQEKVNKYDQMVRDIKARITALTEQKESMLAALKKDYDIQSIEQLKEAVDQLAIDLDSRITSAAQIMKSIEEATK